MSDGLSNGKAEKESSTRNLNGKWEPSHDTCACFEALTRTIELRRRLLHLYRPRINTHTHIYENDDVHERSKRAQSGARECPKQGWVPRPNFAKAAQSM